MADQTCDYVDCDHNAVWALSCHFGRLYLCGGHFAELREEFVGSCKYALIDD